MKRVLTVAESDSCSGSGIQADIKTIMALGGYATTVVSSVTAQNSHGIHKQVFMEPAFIVDQMTTVLADIGTDSIKVGSLGSTEAIDAVADVLDKVQDRDYKIVVDPVMVTRSGDVLLDHEAIAAVKRRLFVRATVITPNKHEAELLTGLTIKDLDSMRHAADMMRTLGADAVILKGGQLDSEHVVDLLAYEGGEEVFETPMVECHHTHGAGYTLASAVAISLAQGQDFKQAMRTALDFLGDSIKSAPGFGDGVGPVNQSCNINAA